MKNLYTLFIATMLGISAIAQTSPCTVDTFTTSGTWICPSNITSIKVECWGAGGGGGGTWGHNGLVSTAAGGGGGAYASSIIYVVPGNSYSCSVGVGGIIGTKGNGSTNLPHNGGNGGNSAFATTVVVAAGGAGGGYSSFIDATNGVGGQGGQVSTSIGTTLFAGSDGLSGKYNQNFGGTGGNAGGPNGGVGGNSSNPGAPGNLPGGGAGGGKDMTQSGAYGGSGAAGLIVITYILTTTANNNGPVCTGNTLSLTASTITGATYSWTGPNGFTSTSQNPTVSTNATIAMAGTYYVTAIYSGCLSLADSTTVIINQATANNNGPVCEGSTLSLTASAIPGATYFWTGPNGFTSTLQNPIVSTSASSVMAGAYSVYTTANGCTSPTPGTTTVVVNPIPNSPTAGNNGPVCIGNTLSLVASTVTGATYSWTGPNSFTSTQQTPTVSTSATTAMAGTYYISATVNGCTSLVDSTIVEINKITANNNGPVCTGNTLSLSATTITGATYSWTGPNSFTSSQQNPIVSTNATTAMAGAYNVTSTANGCTSPSSVSIVIINTSPSAPTAGNNSPICAGSPLALTATTISGCTYSWAGPNSFTSTTQNPTVSGSATTAMSGYYKVKAISTGNGCSSPLDSTIVTVNPIPSAPTAGNNGPVCAGSELSLTASTVTGATYSWTGPNSFTSTLQNPTVSNNATTTMTGTYYVTALVNGCTSSSSTSIVIVNATPSTPVITQISNYLNSSASSGNQWYDDSGIIPSATAQTYIPTITSHYYCIVTAANGCKSDTSNIIYVVITGLNELSDNKDIYIYPNPANDNITIVAPQSVIIEITNIQGQLIKTFSTNGNKASVDVYSFPSGMYFLKLKTEKGIAVKKFIKE